jgi:hypothetical protein
VITQDRGSCIGEITLIIIFSQPDYHSSSHMDFHLEAYARNFPLLSSVLIICLSGLAVVMATDIRNTKAQNPVPRKPFPSFGCSLD